MRNLSLSLCTFVCTWVAIAACQKPAGAGTLQAKRTNEALCASEPAGKPAHNPSLRAAQTKLRSDDSPASFVAVGQAFVQNARNLGDPAQYLNADACAELALTRDPHDKGALNLRALVWLNEHRFSEVKQLAERALAESPGDAMLWGSLSDAELELGNIERAIDAAQRMMDLKPNLPSYGRAAHLRWLQGDSVAAKAIYKKAIAAGLGFSDPEPAAWMLTEAALVFWHEGDYAGADAGLDAALARVPDYTPALVAKGRVALSRGEYRAAAKQLERALAKHESIEAAWLLGDAYELAGDAARAIAAYARVENEGERFDPRTLALFYATKNREPATAVRLARAEYEKRHDLYSKDVLAFALYRKGELAEAERLSREAIAAGTRDARLLYHAGLAAIANGHVADGRALTARALVLNPRFDAWLTREVAL